MNKTGIDSHIHFEMYKDFEQQLILNELDRHHIEALISVSNDLKSAQKILQLSQVDNRIKPAFGFHPEQQLPKSNELQDFIHFIEKNQQYMVAIGEVGMPYYLKKENPELKTDEYLDLLEIFIKLAVKMDKPVVLHAIYEDAGLAIDLLEKHAVKKAHFHWFKGDSITLERMMENGYYISFTPDLLYEDEIQKIARNYPLSQIMVETDGPWPFEGPFQGKLTHPKMIHETIATLAQLKRYPIEKVYKTIYENTKQFYLI